MLKIPYYPVAEYTALASLYVHTPQRRRDPHPPGEVREYPRVTDLTRYRLASAKRIPACKAGGTWRFSRADLDAWIRPQGAEGQGGNGPTSTPDRRG